MAHNAFDKCKCSVRTCTASVLFVSYGNTETVKMLLTHGAIIDHREKVNYVEHVYLHTF